MPRYNYQCSNCEHTETIFHSINDSVDVCTNCGESGTMFKLLSKPLYKTKNKSKQSVGDLTEEYIKDNRELLEQQKAKREDYDPT
jgi:putative FmdB family regulatory protein